MDNRTICEMAGGKRRSSSDQLDSKKALDSSVNQDFPMKIFMNGKLRTFIVVHLMDIQSFDNNIN